MMAEARSDVSLPGQLKTAWKSGTSARNSVKTFASKAKIISYWVVGFLFLIGCITLFIPYIKEEVHSKKLSDSKELVPKQQSTLTQQPQTILSEAQWKEKAEDGSLPVGVWSDTFVIEVGCKTNYDAGLGTDFKVRYRFYSKEWKDLKPGTWPPANEVQFMLLKNNRSKVPVKVICF